MTGTSPHCGATCHRFARFGRSLLVVFACGAVLGGCAPRPLYDWGRYEESLQANYVNHDTTKAYSSLEATIVSGQQTGHRVPPGACAEYGFLLYKRGEHEHAIEYFQREGQLFPESKPLMGTLIEKVRGQGSGESKDPPAEGSSP